MSTPEDAAFVLTRVRIEIRHRPSAMRVVAVFVSSAGRLDHAVQRDLFDNLDLSHFESPSVRWFACSVPTPNSIVTGSSHLAWERRPHRRGASGLFAGLASATTGLLALAALLLDLTARLWPAAEAFAWLSPFRYFIPFDLVMGTALPVEN